MKSLVKWHQKTGGQSDQSDVSIYNRQIANVIIKKGSEYVKCIGATRVRTWVSGISERYLQNPE